MKLQQALGSPERAQRFLLSIHLDLREIMWSNQPLECSLNPVHFGPISGTFTSFMLETLKGG